MLKFAIFGFIAAACALGQTPAATPTFSQDIAPIFYASCTTCHRPGQVAPFSLITYDGCGEAREDYRRDGSIALHAALEARSGLDRVSR